MVVSHARGSVLAEKPWKRISCLCHSDYVSCTAMPWSMAPLSQNQWPQDGRKKNLARGGVRLSNDRLPNKSVLKIMTCIMSPLQLIRFTMNTVRNSRK